MFYMPLVKFNDVTHGVALVAERVQPLQHAQPSRVPGPGSSQPGGGRLLRGRLCTSQQPASQSVTEGNFWIAGNIVHFLHTLYTYAGGLCRYRYSKCRIFPYDEVLIIKEVMQSCLYNFA